MAKRKFEVIVKGMTVFGAQYGEIVELDEDVAKRYVEGRYLKPSRKHEADVKGEPTQINTEEKPKAKAKPKQKAAAKKTDDK